MEQQIGLLTLLTFLSVCVNISNAYNDGGMCSAYVYPGTDKVDIKFAAVLGIHGSYKGKCADRISPGALQQAIALNWAVNLLNGVNNTESFIPGVHLGVDVYDDCYLEYLAARHAGDLALRAKGVKECPSQGNASTTHVPIAGLIGTTLSRTTTITADIIRPTRIPMVGVSATLPELGDKEKYPGFTRTVPSDLRQAQVIIELAKTFSWSYIVGIQTADNYGSQGMAEVVRLAKEERICVSLVEEFDHTKPLEDLQLENFVRKILVERIEKTSGTIGVVYFGLTTPFHQLLEFIKRRLNSWPAIQIYLSKVYWVASDALDSSKHLADMINAYKTKILILGPPVPNLPSFENHFFRFVEDPPDWATGPWRLALEGVVKSNLNYGCTSYNFTKDSLKGCNIREAAEFLGYLTATLDSVYLLANSLKRVHKEMCANKAGMCDSFRAVLEDGLLNTYTIQDLDYSSFDPRFVPSEFTTARRRLENKMGDFEAVNQSLYSIQANIGDKFIRIGDYKDKKVNLDQGYQTILEKSQCNDVCTECLNMLDVSYLFHPGDLIILGLFSIHWKSDTAAFGCGAYREKSASYLAMEAFRKSVEYLRAKTKLNFGYLILDDCYNPLRVSAMLYKVLSGDLKIVDEHTDQSFDPSKVVVAIGAQSTPVTLASLQILQNQGIPQISYSSTNPSLDSRINYPYFSRTVSSDAMQATAVLSILKEFKVTYVGAIVIQNTYGQALYELFKSMAQTQGVCVDDAFEITEKTTVEQLKPLLQGYRTKRIKVVLALAMDGVASTILEAALQEDTFVFIASEAWGSNAEIIAGERGERARGSLVLSASSVVEISYGVKEFLDGMNPFTEDSTAWQREFWQSYFKCNLPGSFSNVHKIECAHNNVGEYFSEDALNNLAHAPLTVHSTMATMSAGLAVQSLLNYGKRQPFNPNDLAQEIRKVQLTSAGGRKFRPFLDTGNGNGGFIIYNVQLVGGHYEYVLVGEYLSNGGLQLDMSKVRFYDDVGRVVDFVNSSCMYRMECQSVCLTYLTSTPPPTDATPRTVSKGDQKESSLEPAVIALAILCGLLILVIIIIIVLCVLFYSGKICRKDISGAHYSTSSSNLTVTRIRDALTEKYPRKSDMKPPLPVRKPQAGNSDENLSPSTRCVSPDSDPSHAQSSTAPSEDMTSGLCHDFGSSGSTTGEKLPSPRPHEPMRIMKTSNASSSNDSQHSGSSAHSQSSQPSRNVESLPPKSTKAGASKDNPAAMPHSLGEPHIPIQNSISNQTHILRQTHIPSQIYNPAHFPQTNELELPIPDCDIYRNVQDIPSLKASNTPTGPIVFQNDSSSEKIYMLSPAISDQEHPTYIYVHTPHGIVPIPQEYFAAPTAKVPQAPMQNIHPHAQLQIQPNGILNEPSVFTSGQSYPISQALRGNVLQPPNVGHPAREASSSPPGAGNPLLDDYITPLDVQSIDISEVEQEQKRDQSVEPNLVHTLTQLVPSPPQNTMSTQLPNTKSPTDSRPPCQPMNNLGMPNIVPVPKEYAVNGNHHPLKPLQNIFPVHPGSPHDQPSLNDAHPHFSPNIIVSSPQHYQQHAIPVHGVSQPSQPDSLPSGPMNIPVGKKDPQQPDPSQQFIQSPDSPQKNMDSYEGDGHNHKAEVKPNPLSAPSGESNSRSQAQVPASLGSQKSAAGKPTTLQTSNLKAGAKNRHRVGQSSPSRPVAVAPHHSIILEDEGELIEEV